MRFANFQAQIYFFLLLFFIAFIVWAYRKRIEEIKKFAVDDKRNYMQKKKMFRNRSILRSLALFLMIFALMRPQWGFSWQQVSRRGVDIYFAVDVSKSMLAQDIKPDRLTRTKLALKDIVKKINGDRLGLIAFSGSSFIQCPLTVDYNGFLLSVDSLSTDLISRGGTSLTSAIQEALKGFGSGQKKYNVLVLISDGENHEGDPQELIKSLKEAGVRVFALGIGTYEGELIPVYDQNGKRSFLKDRSGKMVKTRLDDSVLKELALKTGGAYVQASSLDFGLEKLYDRKIAALEEREIESKQAKRYEERFQVFLGLAFLLLILEFIMFSCPRKKEK